MAQSAVVERVATSITTQIKNGALSAQPTLAASHFMLFVISLNGRFEPTSTKLMMSLLG
jgi:hypothetical protein